MKHTLIIILVSITMIVGSVLVWGSLAYLREEKAYQAEIARFNHVINEASDEELFLMLRTAISSGFVPLLTTDPDSEIHNAVGTWYRTGLIYKRLSERKDLLSQIYPDLERLHEYMLSQHAVLPAEWVREMNDTILKNLSPDAALYDSIYWKSELMEKYFGTPLMKDYW